MRRLSPGREGSAAAVRDLRASSAMLAEAVARAAVADGVAVVNPTNPAQAVRDAVWRPAYPGISQL
jgi:malate dehydrogenase (oxaloacetate-decarboxylating)